MEKDKEKEMFLNACLEEYKTLREESRQASINMITSLSIGLGVVIFLVLASINLFVSDFSLTYGDKIFLLCIFCVVLPLLLGLIIAFWLGELARFKRAGNYICFIEEKISILLKDFYEINLKDKWKSIQEKLEKELHILKNNSDLGKPLQWETWLRSFEKDRFSSTSGHMPWIYFIRLIILAAAFILVWFVGVVLFSKYFESIDNILFLLLLLFSLIASFFSFSYLMMMALKLSQKQIISSNK